MKDFTNGNEAKLIFPFTLPMLFGNVFQQLYNTVDSVIVGRALGEEKLASVGASFPIIFLMISLIMGITIGSTILISQYFGAKDMENVKKAMDTTYVFLLISSLAITALGLLFSGAILRLVNVPEEIFRDAKSYLDIIFIGMTTTFGYNTISAMLRGLGDSKTPLFFLIASTIMNIILDLLFVLGFKWGIQGAAWATVFSQAASFVGGFIYLSKTHPLFKFNIKDLKFDRDMLLASIKIGLPSSIQQMLVSIGMISIQKLVNGFGTYAMAAFTAAGRLDSFAVMPAMNFSQAITSFTGQNIGAGKPERVKKGFIATLIMSGAVSVFISIIMMMWGKWLIHMFNTNSQVVDIGSRYLLIVSAFYVLFSTMFVANGVIRGTGHTMFTMFVTLGSLWLVRVPISTILSRRMGTDGIWWGIPIGWAMGCIISVGYYMSGRWKVPVAFKHGAVQTKEEQMEISQEAEQN